MHARDRLRGAREFYDRHRLRFHLLSFLAGFAFDAVAASGSGVDHAVVIAQQIAYLSIVGVILYIDFLREARPGEMRMPPRLERLWEYRSLVVHFCLGTLMNLYSIFFLLSASLSSSIVFVVILFAAVVLNEMEDVRQHGVDVKIGFFVICVFCFFSLLIPLALGHVGTVPFLLSFAATMAVIAAFYYVLRRRLGLAELKRRLLLPALSVSGLFLALYWVGLIPPVPIAARKLGVYHRVERHGDDYLLFRQQPAWKFWESGDQTFLEEPGDRVYVFASLVAPARFDDTVYMRWSVRDAAGAWHSTDRIPIHFTGGREGGFRGYTYKTNCAPGDWRATIETNNGLEIARVSFTIESTPPDPQRVLVVHHG